MAKRQNVLLVGSGGREHAIAWKLSQSPILDKLFVLPGNAGTAQFTNVAIDRDDVQAVADFAERNDCFTIVGPESPLCAGLMDELYGRGLQGFGPTREQAKLEGSKSYAKSVMDRCGIRTARYAVFDGVEPAKGFAESLGGCVVVKADGLAAGKGVIVCSNMDEVGTALKFLIDDRILGEAGQKVVIEERLEGYEVSIMALCDGRTAAVFGTATDYKRAFDGDRGPNTGGMGSCSPALGFDSEMENQALEKVVKPVVKATGFRGFLYAGLMIRRGVAYVLEFNARLGDPEAQSILPRLESDLLNELQAVADGGTDGFFSEPRFSDKASCCIVMCSEGYPGPVRSGYEITGCNRNLPNDVHVFHSGTNQESGKLVTSAGRVLSVVGVSGSLSEARDHAYRALNAISWPGEHHRKDIGIPPSKVELQQSLS